MARRKDGTRRGSPPLRIIPNKNRRLQVQPAEGRRLFGTEAKAAFLEWFGATCNISLAARKIGFHYRTVLRHWREDPEFEAECEAALKLGYARLEALALEAALEALDPDRRRGAGACDGDEEDEGDEGEAVAVRIEGMDAAMALQLLREHKRAAGRAGGGAGSGRGGKPGPSPKKWTFDEAIRLLDKKLQHFGLRHGIPLDPAPDQGGEEEAPTGPGARPA